MAKLYIEIKFASFISFISLILVWYMCKLEQLRLSDIVLN